MTFSMDGDNGGKPDWLVVWFPQLLLAAILIPIIVFALMALYFEALT